MVEHFGDMVTTFVRQMDMMPENNMPNMPASTPGMMKMPMAMHEMMSPYLFGNKRNFFVLFREARVTTAGGLAGAIIASFAFAVLATVFASFSKTLEKKSANTKARVSGALIISSVSFAVRMFLHYIAMLIVMTMNIWLLIAVTVGHALGYFIFNATFKNRSSEAPCDC